MSEAFFSARLNIPADLKSLPPVLAFAEELALKEAGDSSVALKIRLALEEILLNIIQHGYPDNPDGRITLICETPMEGIRLAIREKGIPYDPDKACKDNDTGMGMRLASYAVSEMHYNNLGREGREVVLVQNLPAKHVASILSIDADSSEKKESPNVKPPENITIRRLRKEDALEVSRCAYLTYGYAYEEFIYYPEQIAAMNESGVMISVVAIGDGEHFMGHLAAKRNRPDDVLLELGVMLVAPAYRSLGIAGSLNVHLLDEIKKTSVKSVFARAVAGHTVSQKMGEKIGLRPCAIMLGTFPKNVEFKQLTGVITEKMSCLVLWKAMQQPRKRKLHIPPRHREWIERIYDNLGLPWQEADTERQAPCPSGKLPSGHLVDILNIGEIDVPDSSHEMIPEVHRTLRQLCLKGADVVYIHINIEHPGAGAMVEALENHDCLFGGVIPDRLAGRDALVLQYLHNVEINYDTIKLTEGFACDLLGYIRALDATI